MKESDIRGLGPRISDSTGQHLIGFALSAIKGYPHGTDLVIQTAKLGTVRLVDSE